MLLHNRMATGEAGRISRYLERLTPAETGLLVRLDSWISRTPGETILLKRQNAWKDRTPVETGLAGVTRILEILDSLRERTPGEARQLERLHRLLKRQDSLTDRTLERKVTWRN